LDSKILLQFDRLNPSFTKRPKDGIPDHSQKREEVPLRKKIGGNKKTHHFLTKLWEEDFLVDYGY